MRGTFGSTHGWCCSAAPLQYLTPKPIALWQMDQGFEALRDGSIAAWCLPISNTDALKAQ